MHGIFNRGLQSYVRDIFGPEIWEACCTQAGLSFFNFETMLKYDDGVTDRVIEALTQVLGRPRDELLEDFGTYVVSEEHFASVRRLLRFGGETYEEFLHSLEDLHDRAKMAIPDLDVPRLRLTAHPGDCFTLHYHFAKQGYGSIFLGLLRAMADDYGSLVVVEHLSQQKGDLDADLFEISLLQSQTAAPKELTLPEAGNDGMPISLNTAMLDILMPLHVQISRPGIIRHVGPTFARLLQGRDVVGESIFEVMDFRRPSGMRSWQGLQLAAGTNITARFYHLPDHNLKAVCVPLIGGDDFLVDFSLGAGVHDIVSANSLNSQSFSPADPTAEMVFLKEVQYIVLANSIDLSARLDGAKKAAETQALTDPLTGLHNRRALCGFIRRLLDRQTGASFAIMQIDLDFFKAVNDTNGHAAGDYVLQAVARLLKSEIRNTDMVARIGGDEFVVVLSDYGIKKQLEEVAARIIRKVGEPILFEQQECQIGASIGATIAAPTKEISIDDLLAEADGALYLSKRQGRGRFNLAREGDC
ncbi:MAG: diguanylate cyclase [Rhodobacteraceae bacterium]|nr:diguanylate cyclase [Paracoccaceae bacterium]